MALHRPERCRPGKWNRVGRCRSDPIWRQTRLSPRSQMRLERGGGGEVDGSCGPCYVGVAGRIKGDAVGAFTAAATEISGINQNRVNNQRSRVIVRPQLEMEVVLRIEGERAVNEFAIGDG